MKNLKAGFLCYSFLLYPGMKIVAHDRPKIRYSRIQNFVDPILVGQLISHFLSVSIRKCFLEVQTRLAKSFRPIRITRDEFQGFQYPLAYAFLYIFGRLVISMIFQHSFGQTSREKNPTNTRLGRRIRRVSCNDQNSRRKMISSCDNFLKCPLTPICELWTKNAQTGYIMERHLWTKNPHNFFFEKFKKHLFPF